MSPWRTKKSHRKKCGGLLKLDCFSKAGIICGDERTSAKIPMPTRRNWKVPELL
jgi:hypothetical protein